jgi:hypothetical protein
MHYFAYKYFNSDQYRTERAALSVHVFIGWFPEGGRTALGEIIQ